MRGDRPAEPLPVVQSTRSITPRGYVRRDTKVLFGVVLALGQFSSHADHGFQAALNVRVGRGPRRHADAHGCLSLPDSSAAPTGAILLNTRYNAPRRLSIPECHQYLIEYDLVQNAIPRRAQAFRKARCMAT